ncbi:MAG TPA: hypothetical protein VFD49_03860 [Candidatus Dormibacteraeota bacterium]|nr:hypothetical protein [Candidatus Dormibacteraeota bacterium]
MSAIAYSAATELKIYGRALEVTDVAERSQYGDALGQLIQWRPAGDFHLFRIDVSQAGFVRGGENAHMFRWRVGQPPPVAEPRPSQA